MTGSEQQITKWRLVPEIREILDTVSKMPLYDAAYHIWIKRYDLAQHEREAGLSPPLPESDLSNWDGITMAIRKAVANVHADKAHAHKGPTFYWLKAAHPDRSDAELQTAIRAVIKIQNESHEFYTREEHRHRFTDVRDMFRLVHEENPEFGQVTLQHLEHRHRINWR